MQRQSAFINPEGNHGSAVMLKGALHCHTTRSDGKDSPEDVIRMYASKGYAFVSITDHNKYNYKNFASETNIIIVPGVETDSNILGDEIKYCFHTVSIGPSSEDGNGYVQDEVFKSVKVRDQFEFQRSLDRHHANNNMTFYCHPQWSSTPARDFDRLTGNFAMEIWNSGVAVEYDELDSNAAYWDELLMQNIKIYGVAVDDGHKANHYGLGWVMVNAKPELNAILAALKAGSFYSSCGPEIYDFYIDNGTAVVECSPCTSISFVYGHHSIPIIRNSGRQISRAEFKVPGFFRYVRVSVKDNSGRRAWSNPVFLN